MATLISMDEVKKHMKESVWIVIHDDVYDVTSFLEEHPGGSDIILEVAGTDASQAFEDVGHSEDARILLKKYKIGTLSPSERPETVNICDKKWMYALLALGAVAVGALAYKKYASS